MTVYRPLLLAILLGSGNCADAWADGGQIRAVTDYKNYRLTVFTSPTPMRAGPVDISVLVQDATSGEMIPDAVVTVELSQPKKTALPIWSTATTAAATNKLLQSAIVDIPRPGIWNVTIECLAKNDPSPFQSKFSMEAGPPLPRWHALWPWLMLPAIATILFGVHRILEARRSNR
jgi:hypothetical protein